MQNPFIDRWKNTDNLLGEISARKRGEPDRLADLRGLPYGSVDFRKDLRAIDFSWVDLSYANFEECNFFGVRFSNCLLRNVNFTELRQWNCVYVNCAFEMSDFSNATLGVGTRYEGCEFTSCKLTGKYFSFGSQNLFRDSAFRKCEIRSARIISVRFERCVFSSQFTNIRFSGSTDVAVSSDQDKYVATLLECDLSGSVFKGVEIMDGAILDNTILPDQKRERFANDRVFYE